MVARIHRGFAERLPGFEVVDVAHSGAEALAAVDRLRPELVLLDVYLPDVSGLAVLRALRAIVKPFDFARFRQTLERYRATASPAGRGRSSDQHRCPPSGKPRGPR
jgi:response regulator of citrate/malate metabolism